MSLINRIYKSIRSRYLLSKYKDHPIKGHLSRLEGAELSHIVSKNKSKKIIEIGSFLGRSTNFIGMNKDESDELHCIDTWQNDAMSDGNWDTYQTFLDNTKGLKNIAIHRGYSREFENNFNDKSIDILFIDADHSYEGCKEDIVNFFPKVKSGGIVIFHDYGNPCGVKKAVDELVKDNCINFYTSDSMFIAQVV